MAHLDFLLKAITSILFVVDPLGAVPTYLVMTGTTSTAKRRATALRASVVATLTMAVFAAVGNALFQLLGLSMPAFGIAGGMILFLVALDMIRAQRPTQEGPAEIHEGTSKDDVAITPLGIPFLAGPAALSTVTMLMSRAHTVGQIMIVYAAILLTGAVSFATLALAAPLHRGLGRTGIHVFSRILGLVLAAIAVQFVLDGLRNAGVVPPPGTIAPRSG